MSTLRTRRDIGLRGLRTLTALAAGALALSACAVGPAGGGAAPDPAKPTIRVAYQSFPSGDLVVKHNRWLEDALPGYTIQWTKFDSGADINTAFVAGELDFGAIGSSPVARGLSAPLNIPYQYQVAFVLDVVYQWIALRWVYPGEAFLVSIILAIVPYVLVRGPVNRLARTSATCE